LLDQKRLRWSVTAKRTRELRELGDISKLAAGNLDADDLPSPPLGHQWRRRHLHARKGKVAERAFDEARTKAARGGKSSGLGPDDLRHLPQ